MVVLSVRLRHGLECNGVEVWGFEEFVAEARDAGNCESLSNYKYHDRLGAGGQLYPQLSFPQIFERPVLTQIGHGVVNLMSPMDSSHSDRPRGTLVAVKRVGGLNFIKDSTPLSDSAQKKAGLRRYRLREVGILRSLERHENIVDVFGVAVDNDGLADDGVGRPVHLVMEYCKVRRRQVGGKRI